MIVCGTSPVPSTGDEVEVFREPTPGYCCVPTVSGPTLKPSSSFLGGVEVEVGGLRKKENLEQRVPGPQRSPQTLEKISGPFS